MIVLQWAVIALAGVAAVAAVLMLTSATVAQVQGRARRPEVYPRLVVQAVVLIAMCVSVIAVNVAVMNR